MKQLELPLSDASPEELPILTERVFSELTGKEASAATSKKVSYLVEKAVSVSPVGTAVTFLTSLLEYLPFVTGDRFGSHVLQSSLARLVQHLASGANDADAFNAGEVIVQMSDELLQHGYSVMQDTTGTHVVRSVLAALGGLPAPAQRKSGFDGSKKAKKKKSRAKQAADDKTRADMNALAAAGGVTCATPAFSAGPTVRAAIKAWIDGCASWSAANVMEAACDTNAGPVLQILVQAAAASDLAARETAAGAAPPSAKKRRALTSATLKGDVEGDLLPIAIDVVLTRKHDDEPEDDDASADGSGSDSDGGPVASGAGGGASARGSHADGGASGAADNSTAEERVVQLMEQEVGCRLVQCVVSTAPRYIVPWLLEDVAEDNWGAILGHSTAHHAAADLIAASAHTGSQLESGVLVDVLPLLHKALQAGHERIATALTVAGSVKGVKQRTKNAIATGLLRTAKKYVKAAEGDTEEAIATKYVKWWLDIGGERSSGTMSAEALMPSSAPPAAAAGGSDEEGEEGAPGTPPRSTGVGVLAASANKRLPGISAAADTTGSYVSVHGARVVGTVLLWQGEAAETFRKGMGGLSGETITHLAMHPASCKFLLEPLLAPAAAGSAPPHELAGALDTLRRKVMKALKGNWATLALDRSGCWLVEKAFLGSDLPGRARLAHELAGSERTLGGTPSGRAILRVLRLQHFLKQRSSWDATQSRQIAEAAATAAADGSAAQADKSAKKEKKEKKEKKDKKEKKSKKRSREE